MASIDNVDLKVNRLNRGGKHVSFVDSYPIHEILFHFFLAQQRKDVLQLTLSFVVTQYSISQIFFFSSAFQKSQTWEQCNVNPAKYFTSWESYAKSTDRELDTVGLWAMNGEQWNLKFFGVRFVHWNIILFIYSKIAIVQQLKPYTVYLLNDVDNAF